MPRRRHGLGLLRAATALAALLAPQAGRGAALPDLPADRSPGGAPVRIGPWTVQAWNTRAGAFSHCTLHRLDSGFVAAFSRSASGYGLALGSVRWHLREQSSFPVLLTAGAAQTQAQALATGEKVVSIGLQRNPALIPRIVNEFKTADALEIRIEGETFRIPADGAEPALAELDRCWREHRHLADEVGATRPPAPNAPAARD